MSRIPSDVRVAVVVVAAGSGTRLGHGLPKAFVSVRGATILERALRSVFAASEPAQVVVVAPSEFVDDANAIALRAAGSASEYVSVVVGGSTRQESVAAGLAVLDADVEVVLVHDAARALASSELFDRVVAAVRERGAGVIPALPVIDTVKRVEGDVVVAAVDRSELVQVQTPQGFPRAQLLEVYASPADDHTDDAALFAAAGGSVVTILGEPQAFKITTPWDLGRAEQLVRGAGGMRSGLGVDVHGYDAESAMWLGGVHFPGEPGLSGHSDGDALIHAVVDALLSAAGLGDIGSQFGTADPRFAGAASGIFLDETLRLVADAGFRVEHVAVQVVGKRPRLSARRGEIESHLSAIVGAPVSVSATTTDGLGFTGRGDGLLAVATALVSS